MTHHDVAEVDEVWRAAFGSINTGPSAPASLRSDRDHATDLARIHHLITTDPGGAAVAADGSRIVGICQASRRGDAFLLSRLGVAPDYQERGIGRELLSMALAYAKESDKKFIFSSRDPRALHTYIREGFTLHPCIHLSGRARNVEMPGSIRLGDARDVDMMDEIDRTTRGFSRREDLELWLDLKTEVLIDEEGGYLLFMDNRLFTMIANSVETATRLLSCALVGAFDHPPLEVGWIVPEQHWALSAAISSRASIAVQGAVLTKDVAHFVVPYLASASLG